MSNLRGPDYLQVRQFMHDHSLSTAEMGSMAGVDRRTARRWASHPDQSGHRPMPYSAWILAQLCLGTLTLEEYRAECAERVEQKKEWAQRGWEQ